MYQSETNYTKNQKFVSPSQPMLEVMQINDENRQGRPIYVWVLIGEKEDCLSVQQLDNWLNDYGYEEQTRLTDEA